MDTLIKILQIIFDKYSTIKTDCSCKIKSAKERRFELDTKQIVLTKYSFLLNDYEKRLLCDFSKEQFNKAIENILDNGDTKCQ